MSRARGFCAAKRTLDTAPAFHKISLESEGKDAASLEFGPVSPIDSATEPILDFNSNMLAEFFDRPALGDSRYDPIVWSFLNDVAPTDQEGLARKDRLIQTWITLKRTDPPSTSAGKDKIDRVTSQPSNKLPLTIDDLEDRSAMLEDVRAKVSFLKRDLAALLLSLPEPTGN